LLIKVPTDLQSLKCRGKKGKSFFPCQNATNFEKKSFYQTVDLPRKVLKVQSYAVILRPLYISLRLCVCSTTNEIRRLSPEDMNPRAKTTRCQLQTVFIVAAFHFHLITKEELVLCLRGHWQCIVFRFFWSHFFHPPMRCS